MRDTKSLIKELEWWWDVMRTDEESDKVHILSETIERLRALQAVVEAARQALNSPNDWRLLNALSAKVAALGKDNGQTQS